MTVPLLVDRVVAPFFATNCWIVAKGAGEPALIVDPGIDIPNMASAIASKLNEHRLTVGALLITHGHLDHTFSLLPTIEECGAAATYIHPADRDLLLNPERAMGEHGLALLKDLREKMPNFKFAEPEDVIGVSEGSKVQCGALEILFAHTPGHTPGSVVATIDNEVVITGDTLFAGSIGRTDLPRGSISEMARSLREKIAPLAPHLEILPGHGETSRMEYEMTNNPYLRSAIAGKLA